MVASFSPASIIESGKVALKQSVPYSKLLYIITEIHDSSNQMKSSKKLKEEITNGEKEVWGFEAAG